MVRCCANVLFAYHTRLTQHIAELQQQKDHSTGYEAPTTARQRTGLPAAQAHVV